MMLEFSESQTWSAEVGREGIQVRVRSGEVWITRQSDTVDHVVQAPEIFDSKRKGRLVLLALTHARVEITPLTSPARAAGRVAHAAAR